jgi:hypothetical protein
MVDEVWVLYEQVFPQGLRSGKPLSKETALLYQNYIILTVFFPKKNFLYHDLVYVPAQSAVSFESIHDLWGHQLLVRYDFLT